MSKLSNKVITYTLSKESRKKKTKHKFHGKQNRILTETKKKENEPIDEKKRMDIHNTMIE